MSFYSQKIQKKAQFVPHELHTKTIEVVQARDYSGRQAYYVIALMPLKKFHFYKAIESGAMNIADYGTVIESGYGETIPQEIKEKYGVK